ncbi:SpoVR family protein [Pseudoduganella aquatica]|nr:SpoVR family protein [Pseudoduganella aquatica]
MSRHLAAMEALAAELGLECGPVDFEQVPESFMLEIAIYGLPVRMRHWSFGLRYLRQMTARHMGQSRIYEVMFPGAPCRAFLADSNTEAENALVGAHVLGHADFSRRNALLRGFTDPGGSGILERSAAHARLVERAALLHGQAAVDTVLDAALALEAQVDVHAGVPERDLLLFIARNAPELQDWERGILLAVREEVCYFHPVHACQIMNEGWACYWHARLLREAGFLAAPLYLEAIRVHSDIVRPCGDGRLALQLNPYHLGYALWDHIIERRGLAEARRICRDEDDFGFIRNYLDRDVAAQLQLFAYMQDRDGAAWLASRDLPALHEAILAPRYNYGAPSIRVAGVGAGGRLALAHDHDCDGRGLAQPQAERVLDYIARVWRRPVELHTVDQRGAALCLQASPQPDAVH